MTDQEIRKLSRTSLLEMLVQQGRELEQVKAELQAAKEALESKSITIEKAGNIAEASLALNCIFEKAQEAADQYLGNIKNKELELQAQQQANTAEADKLLEQARIKCKALAEATQEKCEQLEAESRKRCEQLEEESRKRCEQLEEECRRRCEALEKEARASLQKAEAEAVDSEAQETAVEAEVFEQAVDTAEAQVQESSSDSGIQDQLEAALQEALNTPENNKGSN
jgi:hypothetical protein